jgi:UDP-N-acetylglucosamine transferase subunit ALG13
MKIFLTVGTHPMSFARLVKALDQALAEKKVKAQVFGQIGHTPYTPKHFPAKVLLSQAELEKRIEQADLVVSHGGAGSIINSLSRKKRLVVVPRLARFEEHTNDHQLDLCQALARQKKVLCLTEMDKLVETINQAGRFKFDLGREKNSIGRRIGQAFKEWGLT